MIVQCGSSDMMQVEDQKVPSRLEWCNIKCTAKVTPDSIGRYKTQHILLMDKFLPWKFRHLNIYFLGMSWVVLHSLTDKWIKTQMGKRV